MQALQLVGTVIGAVLIAGTATGTTLHVQAGGGAQYESIGEAIQAAGQGDTVLVGPGTYIGPDNRMLDFSGVNMVVASEAGPESTIIDCEGQESAFTFHSDEDTTSVVAGMTITHADVRGIRCWGNTSPAITDCIFVNNGEGIACYFGASPLIRRCVFSGNADAYSSGAIHVNVCAHPVIAECRFMGNSAGEVGGAVLCLAT